MLRKQHQLWRFGGGRSGCCCCCCCRAQRKCRKNELSRKWHQNKGFLFIFHVAAARNLGGKKIQKSGCFAPDCRFTQQEFRVNLLNHHQPAAVDPSRSGGTQNNAHRDARVLPRIKFGKKLARKKTFRGSISLLASRRLALGPSHHVAFVHIRPEERKGKGTGSQKPASPADVARSRRDFFFLSRERNARMRPRRSPASRGPTTRGICYQHTWTTCFDGSPVQSGRLLAKHIQ